jgi:geranylgeranyl reductase family protein
MVESYDIVVVGAGPAGSSAARAAAQRGARVLLIDRKQRIGLPVQCAELVSQWISRHASFTSGAVIQSTGKMIVHLPGREPLKMKSPGYMLDRSLFDKELAASAILAGAEISTGTKALETSSGGILIQRDNEKEWVRTKVIIGADGVHSTVARWTQQPLLKVMAALQFEVVLFEPRSHVDIFFHPDYEGGYGWFFPKGRTANAGVGVISAKTARLPELLSDFFDLLTRSGKLPRVQIVSKTGGSIPCGLHQQTVFGNILLAGDAAGHAHPVTGAGIFNAVLGGELAGRIAAEAVARGDMNHLANYETEWREAFGKSLSYGAYKREMIEDNWNKPEISFESLIRKTWVSFKEYYEDRRKIPL